MSVTLVLNQNCLPSRTVARFLPSKRCKILLISLGKNPILLLAHSQYNSQKVIMIERIDSSSCEKCRCVKNHFIRVGLPMQKSARGFKLIQVILKRDVAIRVCKKTGAAMRRWASNHLREELDVIARFIHSFRRRYNPEMRKERIRSVHLGTGCSVD